MGEPNDFPPDAGEFGGGKNYSINKKLK